MFVNLHRGKWLAPLRPESVYDQVAALKRRLGNPGAVRQDAALVLSHACVRQFHGGAPVHVVQRYLGHGSPEMAMRYAATLASTAEREFLAMVKIGRDARELGMDRRDMLDLLQLDRRTDRMLPNGYCLVPPRQVCGMGKACLTCDKFAAVCRSRCAAPSPLIPASRNARAATLVTADCDSGACGASSARNT